MMLWLLLSQLDVSPSWAGLAGTGITGGILVWYLWYSETRSRPVKEAEFTRTLATMMERHSEQVRAIEQEHTTTLMRMAQEHREERHEARNQIHEIAMGFRADVATQRKQYVDDLRENNARWEGWVLHRHGLGPPKAGESGILVATSPKG